MGGFRRRLVLLLLTSIILLIAVHSEAQDRQPSESAERRDLLGILETLPDLTAIFSDAFILSYADYRAAERVVGSDTPQDAESLKRLDEEAFKRWSAALSRIHAFPTYSSARKDYGLFQFLALKPELTGELIARSVPGVTSVFRELPTLVGIEWFAIDRALAFGMPPYEGVLLNGASDFASVQSVDMALQAYQFEKGHARGIPVWLRFDEYDVRPDAAIPPDKMGRRPNDPFGVSNGYAARILFNSGKLVGTRSSELASAIVDTWVGDFPTLHSVPAYRAAVEAVTDHSRQKGHLIQALFHNKYYTPELISERRLGPYVSRDQKEALAKSLRERVPSPLEPYKLIVLADRQDGQQEISILGIVYSNRGAAEYAVKVLPELFRSYEPIRDRVPLVDLVDMQIMGHLYVNPEADTFVSVIEFRRAPAVTREEEYQSGKIFRILSLSMYNQDMDPLVAIDR